MLLALNSYIGYTEDKIKKDIAEAYKVDIESLARYQILIADNEQWDYKESSWFLLRDINTGKLYENHASHCSCYGYEGQWEPEETSVEYLLSNNSDVSSEYRQEILDWINGTI